MDLFLEEELFDKIYVTFGYSIHFVSIFWNNDCKHSTYYICNHICSFSYLDFSKKIKQNKTRTNVRVFLMKIILQVSYIHCQTQQEHLLSVAFFLQAP